MLKLTLSKKDLRKNKLIGTEDWFRFKLVGVTPGVSKKDKTPWYQFDYVGVEGEAEDVQVSIWFSLKFIDKLFAHIEALTGEPVDRDAEEFNYDLHALVGEQLEALVVRGEDQNGDPSNSFKRVRYPEAA